MFPGKKSGMHITGFFSYNDPAAQLTFSTNKISTGQMVGDQVTFSGIARTRQNPWQKIAFTVNATGNANPGTQDTFSITINGSYSANSQLTSGSIRIR
jgi:hypothetical protein